MAQQDEKDDWHHCGVAWPHREGEGFNIDVHFQLAEGSRLVILPRKNGSENQPWDVFRVKAKDPARAARSGAGGGGGNGGRSRDDDDRRGRR